LATWNFFLSLSLIFHISRILLRVQPKINTDITTTQIAINYVIAKGGVPLPEINTPKEADELLGCLGWSLTDDELEMLDSAATLCQLSKK